MHNTRTRPTRRIRAISLAAASLLSAGVVALSAQTATAEVIGPAVVLGPTMVLNGVATVTGSVGATNSNAAVKINGQSADVDAAGNFAAVVDLAGQSSLTIGVHNPVTGKEYTTTIPLTTDIVGLGGIIPPTVLENLEQAAVELVEPAGGFVTDGLPITVEGNVGDPDSLSSLSVNGTDVLDSLDSDKSFSVQVPGTLKEIRLSASDSNGTNQLFTAQVLRRPAGTPGSATNTATPANAVGLRIAKVRYVVQNVRRTKRLRMVITIKDSRGVLVRGATVRVRSVKARRLIGSPRLKKTNQVGQAAFLLKARNQAFGKRLVMLTVAQTPKAKATRNTSVRLPRLAKPAARR